MKTTKRLVAAVAAIMVAGAALVFASCNEKDGSSKGGSANVEKLKSEKPAPEADFEVKMTEDGNGVIITMYKGEAKNLVIPAEIQGLPVKRVWSIYDANAQLTSVVIPEGVEVIDCVYGGSLTTVVLPSTLKAISRTTFANCRKLTSINLPEGLELIGEKAFKETGLTSVTLPKSLKFLGYFVFCDCDNLAEINIPDGIAVIRVGQDAQGFFSRQMITDFSETFSGEKIRESIALQKLLKDHKFVTGDNSELQAFAKKYGL